jgi:hypothetical protein
MMEKPKYGLCCEGCVIECSQSEDVNMLEDVPKLRGPDTYTQRSHTDCLHS